jgi:hypothetical protein
MLPRRSRRSTTTALKEILDTSPVISTPELQGSLIRAPGEARRNPKIPWQLQRSLELM